MDDWTQASKAALSGYVEGLIEVVGHADRAVPLRDSCVGLLIPLQGYTVSPQDNYVTRPQNARYLEPSDRRDMHSRFDGAGIRYRFLMQQLAERQSQGDYAYLPDADIGRDLTELFRTTRVE